MGVSGLLGLLKSIQKPCSLADFRGQTVGVDAYGWLHRGAVSCAVDLALGKPTTRYVEYFMHRVRMLLHFGVTPYLVFDGDRLPSKAGTEHERSVKRRQSRKAGHELLRLGKTAQAHQELQKSVNITPEMARSVIEELKRNNVAYVVAPYEADSQMAYLERKGIVDAILSEDSDLLVFGAKTLLTKLDQFGECVMIKRSDFSACREVNIAGWSDAEFRTMAILSGCDYLPGIPKMGLKTAHRFVRKYKTIDKVIKGIQLEAKMRVPPGYLESFVQAETTFLHQWVYCPEAKELVNFNPATRDGQLDGLTYIGAHVESAVATGVALGNLNPMTKQPIEYAVAPMPARQHFQRSQSTPMATTNKQQPTGKGIDAFFKPRRTPLAELDPNMFHPSPSQQQLLNQADSTWTASPAPLHRTVSQPQAPPMHLLGTAASSRQPLSVMSSFSGSSLTGQTGSQSPKRRRLCQDATEDGSPKKSRFFGTSLSGSGLGTTSRRTSKKKSEFNLWSDDSVAEAMAAIPDASPAVDATAISEEKDSAEGSSIDTSEKLSADSSLSAAVDSAVNQDEFSQPGGLDQDEPDEGPPKWGLARFTFTSPEHSHGATVTTATTSQQQEQPTQETETEPSSLVEASPPASSRRHLFETPRKTSPVSAGKRRRSVHDSAVAILDTPTLMRGSEDLLVATSSSDAITGEGADDVLTSPLMPAKVPQHGGLDDNVQDDEDEGYGTFVADNTHESRNGKSAQLPEDDDDEAAVLESPQALPRRLDLGRFVFGSH